MPRGLDHLVVGARDLDAAAARWEALGFRVGPRNRHPWGTANRLVRLPGFFVELIAVEAPELIVEAAPGRPSFGAFVRDRLAEREAPSMLAVESHDADADAAAFAGAGIGDGPVFRFERDGVGPDGAPARVGFALAFAAAPLLPRVGLFACEQLNPAAFRSASEQRHPNGARAVAGVVLVAENPADHAEALSALVGRRDFASTSAGLVIDTGRGALEVLTPEAHAQRYGPVDAVAGEERLTALRLVVDDPEAAARAVGAAAERRGTRVVVPASATGGTVIAFEAAA